MNNQKSLLQKAQSVPQGNRKTHNSFTDEERMQLALAWLNNEVTIGQVSKAFGVKGTSGYTHMAMGLKHAFNEGLIKYPLGKYRINRNKVKPRR